MYCIKLNRSNNAHVVFLRMPSNVVIEAVFLNFVQGSCPKDDILLNEGVSIVIFYPSFMNFNFFVAIGYFDIYLCVVYT